MISSVSLSTRPWNLGSVEEKWEQEENYENNEDGRNRLDHLSPSPPFRHKIWEQKTAE